MLVGREDALARVTWVVSGARAGRGGALLVIGEPGSGKTALFGAVDTDGLTVLRCTGTQDERELPYGALHALLRPLRALYGELVPVQREALELALGLATGRPPAPLLVGAATLSLLDVASAENPLLVVVDDLHWVDVESRDAIGFAARRLEDNAVGLLVAVRAGAVDLDGIDSYALPELDEDAAAELLAGFGVVRPVALRLSSLAGGNPLALVELARALGDGQRAGSVPLPDTLPSTTPAAAYRTVLEGLQPGARLSAAVAAIAGNVSPAILAEAHARLGTTFDQLATVEATGLLTLARTGIRWRHPLARTAAVESIDPGERRRAHAAIAAVLAESGADLSAVVWHRVGAAEGPDEELAAALDSVAGTAAARGAHQAAAEAWETAGRLAKDPSRRLAEAALEAWAGNDSSAASRLVDEALPGLVDRTTRWRLCLTAGQVAGAAAAPQAAWDWFMLAVDEAESAGDRSLQVRALAESFNSALSLDDPERLDRLAERIRTAADPADPVQVARSHAVQGFVLLNAEQAEAGVDQLRQAIETMERHDLLTANPDLLKMAVQTVMWFGDSRRMRTEIDALVARLRAVGETRDLIPAVGGLAWCDYAEADWESAATRAQDHLDLARIGGRPVDLTDALSVVATLEGARGHTADALAHAAESLRVAESLDSTGRVIEARLSQLVAALSAGDLDLVGPPAHAVADLLNAGRVAGTQPEYLDAALGLALIGERAAAEQLLATLLGGVGDGLRPETRAGELMVRAALGPDSVELAQQAAEFSGQLSEKKHMFIRARLLLTAGSMKRRLGDRLAARSLLRDAEAAFAALGAVPWLVRAQDELRASGATLRTRASLDDSLTASEERVARAVAEGKSNKEIAASLFLSGKTVEFHLGRIYRKLGVRGRSELVRLWLTRGAEPVLPAD